MREGLSIAYNHPGSGDASKHCMYVLEGLAEGAVRANQVELDSGWHDDFPGLAQSGIRYEVPRVSRSHGQHIGTLSEIRNRGKATCIEAACVVAALYRVDEAEPARVQLISTKHRGKERPYRYHAVVRLPDGDIQDASEQLKGYTPHEQWWKPHGHCCHSCALDEPCEGGCDCGGH